MTEFDWAVIQYDLFGLQCVCVDILFYRINLYYDYVGLQYVNLFSNMTGYGCIRSQYDWNILQYLY